MARKKSANDITAQRNRIAESLLKQMTGVVSKERYDILDKRGAKVDKITNRYITNMEKTKIGKKLLQDFRNKLTWDEQKIPLRKFYSKKFSQRTYMGMSNG